MYDKLVGQELNTYKSTNSFACWADDYERDYQQFEEGYYEEDTTRRGARDASPEMGEYVSEAEEARRAEKKARKKSHKKKDKKEKKHKKEKRRRSSPPPDLEGSVFFSSSCS